MTTNPFESPMPVADEPSEPTAAAETSRYLTADTIMPRHLAATLDITVAIIASLVVAASIHEEWPAMQTAAFLGTWFGYFLVPEAIFGRTPGKFLMGLVVVQLDGGRCTWRQAAIRTAFRLLEVNPVLLGALPAAISIITSPRRQRIGDRFAGTLVVSARRWRSL
jgi:uncharacterized RDD family membrane protein YckC